MVHNFIKKSIPPILLQACKGAMAKPLGRSLYTGPYATWQDALKRAKGYDSPAIVNHALKAQQQAIKTSNAFERDGVVIENRDFTYPCLAYLAKAGLKHGKLNVIDFGGGLGSSYFQCKRFFGDELEICWQVVEQPNFVKIGNQKVRNEELSFHRDIQACQRNESDLLLCSSVLQYLENPFKFLEQWSALGFQALLFDRTPCLDGTEHKLMVQHVPKSLYEASYPSWLFSQPLLEKAFKAFYNVEDSFVASEGRVQSFMLDITFKGFWMTRR